MGSADARVATVVFPALSIASAALIVSAVLVGAESQERIVSKE